MPQLKTKTLGVRLGAGVIGTILASGGFASATVVNYGNFAGPNITYSNVSETDTQLPGPTPPSLYGTPSLSGDSLTFNPINFVVSASGGSSEFQDGRLTVQEITPTNPLGNLSLISINEGGAWAVIDGTDLTSAEETLIANELFINQVNGVSVNPIAVTPTFNFTDTKNGAANITTSSIGGTGNFDVTSAGGVGNGSWNLTISFNLPAALAAADLTGRVTGVNLILDNQLTATSETNSSAFIDKKFFNIGTNDTPAVPEPAPATLALGAAACALFARRRRAKTR
jgi:hypothetical protein